MAKRLGKDANGKAPGPHDTASSNSAARADIIRECAGQIDRINEQRADLNDDMGKIRQRLRDSGITVKAVMEAVTKRAQDSKDRNAYEEARLEAFLALGLGTQGTLFGAGPLPARSEAHTDAGGDDDLEENGRTAHAAGGTRDNCPWPEDSDSGKAWLRGFDGAVAKTAAEMHPDTGSAKEDERRPGQAPRNKRAKAAAGAAA